MPKQECGDCKYFKSPHRQGRSDVILGLCKRVEMERVVYNDSYGCPYFDRKVEAQ